MWHSMVMDVALAGIGYYGARVVAVGSAAEALRMLRTHHADVLVSDLRLPEQDRFTLIHELRAQRDPAGAGISPASMTASRRIEDRHDALSAGFQLHIQKPVDPDDLVAAVLTLATASRDDQRPAH